MPHLYAYAANETTGNSSLLGGWVEALGATIFGIVWVDRRWYSRQLLTNHDNHRAESLYPFPL